MGRSARFPPRCEGTRRSGVPSVPFAPQTAGGGETLTRVAEFSGSAAAADGGSHGGEGGERVGGVTAVEFAVDLDEVEGGALDVDPVGVGAEPNPADRLLDGSPSSCRARPCSATSRK